MSNFTITSGATGLYVLTPDDTLHVLSGGRSLDSIVGDKATEYVSSGGDSSVDHVLNGGTLVLFHGATAQGDLIDGGGVVRGPGLVTDGVHDYGLVEGATLQGVSGLLGEDNFFDFGSEQRLHILDSATSFVDGRATDDRIYTGGVEHVVSQGVSADATVLVGGSLVLDAGAVAVGTILAAGGQETAASGAVQRDVKLRHGALLQGSETLHGDNVDAGEVSGATLDFGRMVVTSGGVAQAIRVAGRGEMIIERAGVGDNLTVTAAGSLVDNGVLAHAGTPVDVIRGALSGDGVIAQSGAGSLVDDANGAAFRGEVTIRAGQVILETADGLGRGSVAFEAGARPATLRLQGAGTPASGAVFANALNGFDTHLDHVDLHTQAYVSGAKATVDGSVLTLHDGAYSASFELTGAHAKAYVVSKDAGGGTLIRARGTAAAAIIQAAAGFDAGGSVIPNAHALASPTMLATDLAAFGSTRAHA